MDLQRYLADEPVQACPPSVGYRLRKFVLRNKGPVLTISAIAAALVAGIVLATWGMFTARDAERRAVAAKEDEAKARKKAELHATRARVEKTLPKLRENYQNPAELLQTLILTRKRQRGSTAIGAILQDLAYASGSYPGDFDGKNSQPRSVSEAGYC